MKKILSIATLSIAAFAGSASAQSFNVDFDIATGTGAGAPSAAHGAASGQLGFWNALIGSGPHALSGLGGGATGVTLTVAPAPFTLGNAANLVGATADQIALMGDILDGAYTVTFSGLQNGNYQVYTYAMAPDSATFLTNVTIGGNTQVVGGPFSGSYALGITHSLHNVSVTNNSLVITTSTASGFASLAGIQVVIPGPGGLAAMAVFGLVGSRRRRN